MKTINFKMMAAAVVAAMLFFGGNIFAQKKTEEIKIKTSAQCDQCKERIEKALAFEKGIKRSNLNLDTKEITVVYNPEKTTPEKIRKAIAAVGYDADNVPADEKAYKKLPKCCQKGGAELMK
jgi:mercuric ion binding protein